jgi:hypothetical protein
MKSANKQLMTQGLWPIAIWGPGIAAIITTSLVVKQPFKSLRLNTLGPKRFYLWTCFLPIGLTILGGLHTLLFGIAILDLNSTMIREAMASAASGNSVPVEMIVAIQVLLALESNSHQRHHLGNLACACNCAGK